MKDVIGTPARLRQHAQTEARGYPALLAQAECLAANFLLGEHGRRRPGMGAEFWQYRPAEIGDPLRRIDWRRSARSDTHYIREVEWQASQAVTFWVDSSLSMAYQSAGNHPSKRERASVLALALAVLLNRGGERFGLLSDLKAPRRGSNALEQLAESLVKEQSEDEFGAVRAEGMLPGSICIFISDFFGDTEVLKRALSLAAGKGVKGALVHLLDPEEEAFSFGGRTIFETMSQRQSFETLDAKGLREAYLERLSQHKSMLKEWAGLAAWQYGCFHTHKPANSALTWMYHAVRGFG